MAPKLDAPVAPLYPGTPPRTCRSASSTARCICRPIATRPSRRVVAVPIGRPERRTGRRSFPRARTRSSRRRSSPAELAVNTLEDVASEVRFYDLDGTPAATASRRRPRHHQRTVRPIRPVGGVLHVHVAARIRRRCSGSTPRPARARRSSRRSSRSIRRSTRPSASSSPRRTARACRCSSRTRRD